MQQVIGAGDAHRQTEMSWELLLKATATDQIVRKMHVAMDGKANRRWQPLAKDVPFY